MSGKAKCYDVVLGAVAERSKDTAGTLRENPEKMDILREYCDAIDKIAAEFGDGVVAYDAEIDDYRDTVTIGLECGVIEVEDKQHIFCQLIDRSIQFSFQLSQFTEDNLRVEFVFPSVWDEKIVRANL